VNRKRDPRGPRLTLAILVIGLAACGDTPIKSSVNGPYASPEPAVASQIATRSCAKVKSGNAPSGIDTAKVELVTPGTDLQRVSDDLAGAVPGGNVAVDSNNLSHDADQLYSWAVGSNVCEPLRSQLVDKAKALKDASAALASAATGPDVAAALQTAQAAYKAASDFVDNPPSG
jgi:hypothetical protein